MKKTPILLIAVCVDILAVSCEKEEEGLKQFAGWYDGWYQSYDCDDWYNPDSITSISMQLQIEMHFVYNDSTNSLVLEEIPYHLKEYHLIVQNDGSFVSEEKDMSNFRMYDRDRKPVLSGQFIKGKKGKHQVEFLKTVEMDKPRFTLFHGEKR